MEGPIESYTDLLRNDNARDVWFRRAMCEQGIFMLPTALKRNHVSAAHTTADIDRRIYRKNRAFAYRSFLIPVYRFFTRQGEKTIHKKDKEVT